MQTRDPELPRLPVEVFPRIFKFLPSHHSSLAAMALTCSYFHRHAEPVLYTSFYSDILCVCEGFSKTIIEYPRLAQMVQSYRIHEFFLDWGLESIKQQRSEWLELTGQGLRCMVNLKHLEFNAEYRWRVFDQEISLLRGCTFQLERFIWNTNVDATVVAEFLKGQGRLRWLELGCDLGRPSKAACPDLIVLKANESMVRKLVPGRNIRHIFIHPKPHLTVDNNTLVRLGPYTKEVKQVLSFIMECHISQLPAELECFRSLRYLEILGIYENEVHLIVDLPELHTLVLWSGLFETGNFEQRDLDQQQELVLVLSLALPKLVRVDIGDALSSYVSKYRAYRRWIQGELQPDSICHIDIEQERPEIYSG